MYSCFGALKVYTNMSNYLTVYINQHKFFLMAFSEFFVTSDRDCMGSQCEHFSGTLRYFILIASLRRNVFKIFLHATQKHFFTALCFLHCFLIYFLMTKLVYLIQKTTTLKGRNFCGKKISRISPKSVKLGSREIF